MSNPITSCEEREETLTTLPLHKPLRLRVVTDVGGVSVLGTGPFKGSLGSGNSYAAALADFFDGLILDYYEFSLYPSEVQSKADDERGRLLRTLFHPSGVGKPNKERV